MGFIEFRDGRRYILENGWPARTDFLLSRKSVSHPPVGVTRATWDTRDTVDKAFEIDGEGYGRATDVPGVLAGDQLTFGPVRWETGPAADWPDDVRSIAAVTGDGVLLCAWDLADGAPRDLSSPDTTYEATPVYRL